ncbi:MAG: HD domain-containing protein [Deltaproteobacteria bacterium]|nr:HD domain-containing protein [Deltaproteobacteria bacterium]
MIPSIRECFQLMDTYRMLDNIRSHSVVVARVARLIAQGLREARIDISIETATAGALLHDIGKTASLQTGEDHSELGRQICIKNHLDEIAPIVAEHVRLKDYTLNGDYSEKEIVFYADKRVNHDHIVSLEERLAYILERYGRKQKELSQAIKANFSLCKQVQEKLFRKLTFTPESLSRMARDQKNRSIWELNLDY